MQKSVKPVGLPGNLGLVSQATAKADPERVAIIDLTGREPVLVSYGALEDRMNRAGAALLARGLEPGDRMVLAAGNAADFVVAMFGMMRAGLVPVPVNIKLGAETLAYITADSGARGAVVEAAACPQIVEAVAGLQVRLGLGAVPAGFEAFGDAVAGAAPLAAAFAPGAEDLAFLPYTSGSTGRPKGVPLTHRGQVWWTQTLLTYWPTTPAVRSLVAVPLYHKNAMAGAVKPRLASGGSMVLLPGFEARRFLEAIARYRVTHVSAVPSVFTLLLRERELVASLDLSSLQVAVVGSAPVHEELERDMRERLGVTVMQSYGMTEGGPVMVGPPVDGRPVPLGSCGAAWPEGEVKLVDREGGVIIGAGEGELWVRNPGVPSGYYKLPKVNAERFTDGFLHTGDLFYRDAEGFYFFRGRTDDMFKSAGESVYPKEVENLLKKHPDIVDVCVVPVPHALKGKVPVALVVPREPGVLDEAAIKRFALDHGPAYAHPRRVLFTDVIPISGVGKVERVAIERQLTAEIGTLGDA